MGATNALRIGLVAVLASFAANQGAEAAQFYTVDDQDDMLGIFDSDLLTITDVGPLGVDFGFGGVAMDGSSGILYMVDGRGAEGLYTVDVDTGAASLVGIHGIEDLVALTYNPSDGKMYAASADTGADSENFYEMDLETGEAIFIAHVGGTEPDDLTYDTVRETMVIADAGGVGRLYTVDPLGRTSLVFEGSNFNNVGIAHDPVDDLYWGVDHAGLLFYIDPKNGRMHDLDDVSGHHVGLELIEGGTWSSPELVVDGTCPDSVSLTASGLAPGGQVVVLHGTGLGSTALANGPCAGALTGLATPLTSVTVTKANADGNLFLEPRPRDGACGVSTLQVLNLASCTFSDVVGL